MAQKPKDEIVEERPVAEGTFCRTRALHFARGKRAASAFRRIVRSFSRVLHALIRDGKAFDEDVYIAALKRRGATWAQTL